MNIYDSLLGAVHSEYDVLMLIKKSERGEVSLVRHRDSGTRYIFRHFYGNSEVYQKLLNVSCPNLPQIMEVGEKDGKTALLEEYVQGDTLSEILEGGLLTIAESKQIARQLCSALWVFHSMGVVHRDVKPDNVIIRGKEAVLIDFDASRIYKSTIQEDTQILGTTGFAAPEQYGLSQSDGRADIYALGVLLNIMLTGEHPSRKLADASILNKLSPFFAILFSFILLKEKIHPFAAGCVFIAFVGSLFIIKPGFASVTALPAFVGLLGGMGAGIAYTYVRKLGTNGVKGPFIVLFFSAFSCIVTLPYLIFDFHPMTLAQLGCLLLAGLFASGGQFTITAAYTCAPAGEISIYDYSQIIFSTVLGFLFLRQIPDMWSFVGYGIIIAASVAMFLFNNRKRV